MRHSIHPKKIPDRNPCSKPDQKLLVHYTLNGQLVCEAEYHLANDEKFVQLPIPVIHQMERGTMK